jgi:hypothetical protein
MRPNYRDNGTSKSGLNNIHCAAPIEMNVQPISTVTNCRLHFGQFNTTGSQENRPSALGPPASCRHQPPAGSESPLPFNEAEQPVALNIEIGP